MPLLPFVFAPAVGDDSVPTPLPPSSTGWKAETSDAATYYAPSHQAGRGYTGGYSPAPRPSETTYSQWEDSSVPPTQRFSPPPIGIHAPSSVPMDGPPGPYGYAMSGTTPSTHTTTPAYPYYPGPGTPHSSAPASGYPPPFPGHRLGQDTPHASGYQSPSLPSNGGADADAGMRQRLEDVSNEVKRLAKERHQLLELSNRLKADLNRALGDDGQPQRQPRRSSDTDHEESDKTHRMNGGAEYEDDSLNLHHHVRKASSDAGSYSAGAEQV